MALYWLCYRRDHLQAGAVLVDAPSLRRAQTLAAFQGVDAGLEFAAGHALDPHRVALVHANEIGRLLSLVQAHRLLVRFERGRSSVQMHLRSIVQENSGPPCYTRDAA